MSRWLPWVACAVMAASAPGVCAADTIEHEIAALVESSVPAAAQRRPEIRDWLRQVYDGADDAPAWFAPDGRARRGVTEALAELRGAQRRGFVTDDRRLALLVAAVDDAVAQPTPAAIARADVALSTAMLELAADARFGRVRPQAVEPHFHAAPKDARFVAHLRDAAASGDVSAWIDAAEPAFALYRALQRELVRYRGLAAQPSLQPLPRLSKDGAKIVAGDAYPAADVLRAHLVRWGDLSESAAGTPGIYDTELAAGVQGFQRRHGLAADGVVGKQTLAALDVPARARVQQIELALERLRWLPDLLSGQAIAINIPSFRLWALRDVHAAPKPDLAMAVIVGRAVRAETPVFVGTMRYVEFNPYWNVPPSIQQDELLPRLRRDPGYLGREDMEIVSVRDARVVSTDVDAAALDGLASGTYRLRQRPGAKNALDGIKFTLPNSMNIYLHGTPARSLFEASRRDFSHGCIRVQDPVALAQFVLGEDPVWTRSAIEAAMAAGVTKVVTLRAPIPVIVFYTTAIVDASGRAIFLSDVYGHDRKLATALAAD